MCFSQLPVQMWAVLTELDNKINLKSITPKIWKFELAANKNKSKKVLNEGEESPLKKIYFL